MAMVIQGARQGAIRAGGGNGMVRAIGWVSLGLGLAGVAAPRRVARMIGAGESDDSRDALLAVGLREIASGIGILSRPQSAGWLWARVGGDVMDLALLGAAAYASDRSQRDGGRLAATAAAVAGIAALDLSCARRLGSQGIGAAVGWAQDHAIHLKKTITLNRPREAVYGFWRDFTNLPRVMGHLESVEPVGDGRSRWRAKGPAGRSVEWDAEVTEDRPNERLAWRSLPGGDVDNAGSVRFEPGPGGRGTVLTVELRYIPPGGALGVAIARLFGREPGQEIQEDLRAFKQMMETGEVARSEASLGRIRHPAQAPAG
ncbi:MAG TPA: SRPBCC family protein [Azospirillaceae bacterium]|nr:SRPBCC family protein [Azospirillaceae bacterium]